VIGGAVLWLAARSGWRGTAVEQEIPPPAGENAGVRDAVALGMTSRSKNGMTPHSDDTTVHETELHYYQIVTALS